MEPEPLDEWFDVFDSLKDYFFVALADNQVSSLAILLLKGFITMENI